MRLTGKYDELEATDFIDPRPVIISTRENRKPRNEVGYFIYPINKDGDYYNSSKGSTAFIPMADFDYIISEFKAVFPQQNPWTDIIEDSFDVCGDNPFDNTTCRRIFLFFV